MSSYLGVRLRKLVGLHLAMVMSPITWDALIPEFMSRTTDPCRFESASVSKDFSVMMVIVVGVCMFLVTVLHHVLQEVLGTASGHCYFPRYRSLTHAEELILRWDKARVAWKVLLIPGSW